VQAFGAFAHLGGSLVGEGDGGNLLRLEPRLDQPANLVRDHPRFASAGTSQHQAGAVQVVDGLLLGQVESGACM
jgi:hypothetical protein